VVLLIFAWQIATTTALHVTSRFNCFAGKLGFNKTRPTQVCRSYNGPEIETWKKNRAACFSSFRNS
jgi:hypothetical protein